MSKKGDVPFWGSWAPHPNAPVPPGGKGTPPMLKLITAKTILRLTKTWTAEYEAFRRRDLAERDYVHLWADGVHFTIRLDEERLCTLVLIGVRPDGTKEVVALEDGYRESAESWRTVLRDLKRRGLRAPVLAVGDA